MFTQPFQILGVFLNGIAYDVIGRRFTIILSHILGIVAGILAPFPSPNIYPFYYICKIAFTICGFSLLANPLVNDYIGISTRPRALCLA